MAVVVVGGGGRGAGKTSLVCGVITALPERGWVAVKIASHAHGPEQPVWEDTEAGDRSDTARYLAAGARRAFLLTAADQAAMQAALDELWRRIDWSENFIFESNRVLNFLKPDVCLMVRVDANGAEEKASYENAMSRADAVIAGGSADLFRNGLRPEIELARLEQISPELEQWIRGLLIYG
jgi:hypothetical protein